MQTTVVGDWREGAPTTWTFYLEDGPFDTPAGLAENNQEYWSSFLDYPPISFIECMK